MKKYAIILLFLSVILIGCTTNDKQNMSFDQAVTVFSNNIKNIQNIIVEFGGFTGNKAIDLLLETSGESEDFKLNSDFARSGSINYKESSARGDLNIHLLFQDKVEQKKSTISGNISNILKNNILYFFVNNSFLNIGTGNYQGDLLSLISKNIKHKRISITQAQNINTLNTRSDINFLLDLLSQSSTFNQLEAISYNGDLAYKLEITSDVLQINNFDGMFVVHSASDVELKLEAFDVYLGDQRYLIKGSLSSNVGTLTIQNTENLEKATTVLRENTRKGISLVVSSLLNLQENIKLELKLAPKSVENGTKIQINGILTISPLLIYGSDLEKNIQIDINGHYIFINTTKPSIGVPDSYILGEQFLGDQFSLETIIPKTK